MALFFELVGALGGTDGPMPQAAFAVKGMARLLGQLLGIAHL